MTKKFPDTADGAAQALAQLAKPHSLTAAPSPMEDEPLGWYVPVRWASGREETCAVYLAPHPLAIGPFGADFEVMD